jgi:hypothetical protein
MLLFILFSLQPPRFAQAPSFEGEKRINNSIFLQNNVKIQR